MRYTVKKLVEFSQEVEAETPEGALAAFDPGLAVARVVRERVTGERRRGNGPAAGAIQDREMRPGRKFVARRKGRTYTALVMPTGEIEMVDDKGHNLGSFKTLARAATFITEGKAVNAYALFSEAPAEVEAPAPATPVKAKRRKAAAPITEMIERAAGPVAEATEEPVEAPPEDTTPAYLPPATPRKAKSKKAK